MKKQILLLVFLGISCSVIAMDEEKKSLLKVEKAEKENECCSDTAEEKFNPAYCVTPCFMGALIVTCTTLILQGILTPTHRGGRPECNPIDYNRTQAECVSTQPSAVWMKTLQDLCGMNTLGQYCTPVCSFNIEDGRGIFLVGPKEEIELSEEEWVRFHEFPPDEYEYVFCNDESDPNSWVHRIKSFFTNGSIPYWPVEVYTQKEGVVGIVYPKEYSEKVYNQTSYNRVVTTPSCWDRRYPDDLRCLGKLYK